MAAQRKGFGLFLFYGYFFYKSSLGAEGIGADVDMMIGNGYAHHHSEIALDLLRRNPVLMKFLKNAMRTKQRGQNER